MSVSTVSLRNTLATAYTSACGYVGLLSALTLQASVVIGATTFSSDLQVFAGDSVVFDYGLGTQETRVITSVSGAGPYTVTVPALTYAHTVGALISHLPAVSGNGHELTGGSPAYARVASGWSAVANSSAATSGSAINVPAGSKIGSTAFFSAATAGSMLDADPIAGQSFSVAGTYSPVITYTQS